MGGRPHYRVSANIKRQGIQLPGVWLQAGWITLYCNGLKRWEAGKDTEVEKAVVVMKAH